MILVPMDMKCQQTTSSETTTSMLAALCGGCCGPICDRYIMRVVDTYYHEGCLQCTQCSMRLMHSCFQRNGKLYCRIDYERYVCGAVLWCFCSFNDGQINSNFEYFVWYCNFLKSCTTARISYHTIVVIWSFKISNWKFEN